MEHILRIFQPYYVHVASTDRSLCMIDLCVCSTDYSVCISVYNAHLFYLMISTVKAVSLSIMSMLNTLQVIIVFQPPARYLIKHDHSIHSHGFINNLTHFVRDDHSIHSHGFINNLTHIACATQLPQYPIQRLYMVIQNGVLHNFLFRVRIT